MELRDEQCKPALIDRIPHVLHELQVIMQIVFSIELRAQNLAGTVQMMQIGAREIAAGIALAGFIEWFGVILVTRILDLDIAKARKQPAVACIAVGHYEIYLVDAVRHAGHLVFRRADPHLLMRLAAWNARPSM